MQSGSRLGLFAFIDHPRARVSYEERGRWIHGWLLGKVYRPLISGAVKKFRVAMQRHEQQSLGSQ
jgi:hypothetical protein